MPGKIRSTAQQAFLAIHNPSVLHELSGGHIAKGLPNHVKGSKFGNMKSALGGGGVTGRKRRARKIAASVPRY